MNIEVTFDTESSTNLSIHPRRLFHAFSRVAVAHASPTLS
jgi:hypothetical protein